MGETARLAALDGLWAAHSAGSGAADSVYATLREAIVSGLLRPGDGLIEEHIARRFGVSRTPVREALLRLEAESLATRIPRRGLVVHTISEQEMLELYTVRTALDSLAARLAATEATPTERAQLRWINEQLVAATRRGDPEATLRFSREFHTALVSASHNSLLAQFMEQILSWISRFRSTTHAYPGRSPVLLDEHQALLEALEAHDGEAAERLEREHMEQAFRVRQAQLRERDGAAE